MFCARCVNSIDPSERVCPSCHADLTRPGSVRLTDPQWLDNSVSTEHKPAAPSSPTATNPTGEATIDSLTGTTSTQDLPDAAVDSSDSDLPDPFDDPGAQSDPLQAVAEARDAYSSEPQDRDDAAYLDDSDQPVSSDKLDESDEPEHGDQPDESDQPWQDGHIGHSDQVDDSPDSNASPQDDPSPSRDPSTNTDHDRDDRTGSQQPVTPRPRSNYLNLLGKMGRRATDPAHSQRLTEQLDVPSQVGVRFLIVVTAIVGLLALTGVYWVWVLSAGIRLERDPSYSPTPISITNDLPSSASDPSATSEG